MAAFVAEPIVGATLGAVEPPKGYWPAVADVCRRHGALLIADEVMTGFGRTGAWFGLTHYARPARPPGRRQGRDVGLLAVRVRRGLGRGATTRSPGAGPFVHGFTYSHQPAAAAVALEVLRILEAESLVPASATKGERLLALLHERLDANPPSATSAVAACSSGWSWSATGRRASRIRGRRGSPRRRGRTARERGLLLYSGTGNANGVDGDTILLGPPFVVTDAELTRIADGLADAIELAVAAIGEAAPA